MTDNDRDEFYEIWTAATELLSDKSPTPAALDLCFGILSPYTMAEVRRALGVRMGSKVYGRIQPGEIVELIEGTPDDAAQGAWQRVLTAIRSAGAWESVVFDDPKIHAVIDAMGGWVELCGMTVEDTPYRMQTFCKTYAGLKRMEKTPVYSAVLFGKATGELAKPRLIGDPQACEMTMKLGHKHGSQARAGLLPAADQVAIPNLEG